MKILCFVTGPHSIYTNHRQNGRRWGEVSTEMALLPLWQHWSSGLYRTSFRDSFILLAYCLSPQRDLCLQEYSFCSTLYPLIMVNDAPYNFLSFFLTVNRLIAVAQWLRCCATKRKFTGSIPAGVIGIFHFHKILPIALWPWGRLSLQQKWVPGIFPGGKDGRCVWLTTLPPSWAIVT